MKELEQEIEKLNTAKQTFLTPITFFLEGDRFYVARKDDAKNRSMVGTFRKKGISEYTFTPRTKDFSRLLWTVDGPEDIFQQVCLFMMSEYFFDNIRDLGPLDDFVGDLKDEH